MNVPYVLLQQDGALGDLPGWLGNALSDIIAALPRLIGAIVILLIGWVVGMALGRAVSGIADRMGIDRQARGTPLSRMLGDSRDAVSNFLGKVAKWFVYALAILAAANTLAIPILSQWIATAVSYLPAFIAGLLVIIGGFIVADFIGDAIERTRAATQTAYATWFATGVRMFLYFTAVVIGLDTMGIDVQILYVFAQALAWGLAAGLALAIGISFGWGGKDYVSNNMNRWAGSARSTANSVSPESQDTGSATDDDD
jgi:small-conductance mechanosensitive channel